MQLLHQQYTGCHRIPQSSWICSYPTTLMALRMDNTLSPTDAGAPYKARKACTGMVTVKLKGAELDPAKYCAEGV